MGEPIAVVVKKSINSDYSVFETNRSFAGMGHEQYNAVVGVSGDRSVDQLARLLFEKGNVSEVHIYAQTISVRTSKGFSEGAVKSLIENFYIYYGPGVEVPDESSFS